MHQDSGAPARAGKGAYDLAVIGAGSAGFAAAIAAAELGARVALIGCGTIGGTCVNVGCVPSKTLIRATETLHRAGAAARFAGIRAEAQLTDWRDIMRQKEELVSSLRQAKYVDLLPRYGGIAYRDGRARLALDGVAVNGELIVAGRVIVATGAAPALPSIPGIDAVPYLTSTAALALERLPRSLLVIGGGPIGCELGQMFARAGVKVTIAARRRLLGGGAGDQRRPGPVFQRRGHRRPHRTLLSRDPANIQRHRSRGRGRRMSRNACR